MSGGRIRTCGAGSLGIGPARPCNALVSCGCLSPERRLRRYLDHAAHICIIALLTGCATTPEQKIVASVETLPPQKIAISVLCVKASDIPPMPATKFDPKAEYTEQLSAQAQADIDELKIHIGKLTSIAVGCAKQEPVK